MFFDRLQSVCDMRNKALTSVVRAVACSSGMIDGWKNRGSIPRADVVVKLADYLDTTTDYLLERTDNPNQVDNAAPTLAKYESELLSDLRTANDKVRDLVINLSKTVMTTIYSDENVNESEIFFDKNDELLHHRKKKEGKKPLTGKAAAGAPITVVQEDEETLFAIPSKYMSERFFLIMAQGDSMIDANIDSGDLCVFQSDAYFDDGKIALVNIEGPTDETEATIKRVFFRGETVELHSENPIYSPMIYPSYEVNIAGVLVDILRPEHVTRT